MKKIITTSIAALALFATTALPAFAAMPNYIGTDYKQGPQCTINDHKVYEDVNGKTVVTGCLTPEAWANAMAYAARLQATGIRIAAGVSVVLPDGRHDKCASFLTYGCVAPQGSTVLQ